MSQEIFWLVLTVFMTSLFWLPYILNQLAVLGVLEAMRESAPVTDRLAPWAQRAKRAHANAVENLVIFAPLVIAVYALNVASPYTTVACIVYFCARLAHFVIYTLAVPYLRTVAFAIGFFAQAALALRLLGLV